MLRSSRAAEDPELVREVCRLSSKEYMAAHEDQFSEGWFYDEQLRLGRYERPPLPPVAKVTQSAQVAARAAPSAATVAWMQGKWNEIVLPRTGCTSYAEMRHIVEAGL